MSNQSMSRTSKCWIMIALVTFGCGVNQATLAQKKVTQKKSGRVSAAEVMKRAHDKRAEWTDFCGFKAEIVVKDGDQSLSGTLLVSANGKVRLQLSDPEIAKWVQADLKSLVEHRLPGSDGEYDVSYVKGEKANALGRLIAFNEDRMHSVYRIRYNVITEVHRDMGERKLMINVIDVQWNKEKKILPRTYTVSMTDAKTGKISSTQIVNNHWLRVGKFDLPIRVLKITNKADGAREVREIRLTGHELLKASQ